QLAHARDAAEAAARAKSMFLANMSHELRTPLNSVIGMTHLLLQDAKDPDEKEFLAQISASGQQLNSLIGDLLDLARLDAGDLRLETAAFDLRDIVDSVIGELDAEARSKNLAVTADVDPSITRSLRGDAARLRQALSHLAGNAVKFTRQGGIVIRALRDTASGPSPRLRIEVEDTGIGIPPDTLARLFRPFEQADGSTTRAHGGSGLGLALSRQLVHLMGGRVGVRSVPGQGSTFWLDLPLVEEQTAIDGESGGPTEGPSDDAGEADSPIDWPAARALLDRLEDLLITDVFRAGSLLREAAGPLRAALGPAAGHILDAIADYRFDEALDALRRARMNSPELREEAD
ncbi:MAG: hybrid sensor histidine kinase/response regulator, partial [Rhodocyclaceae bacterium]|nr:hybrid sensor histidine kinase/response regulator [Rhodocyclaceae bacterium]